MLDIGWSELMVIGVLALIVVGPKELPRLLRTVGQFVGKARGIAREFQRSMEDAAREADLKELTDLKRDMDKMARVDFQSQAKRSAESLVNSPKKDKGAEAKADTPKVEAAPEAEASAPKAEVAAPRAEAPPPPAPADDAPKKAASGER